MGTVLVLQFEAQEPSLCFSSVGVDKIILYIGKRSF